jgi:hypothetical protein
MKLSETKLSNMSIRERWDYLTIGCDKFLKNKFITFHKNNLHIFDNLKRAAGKQWEEGWKKSSVWLLLNIERWSPSGTIGNDEEYKISNNYFAFYSRLLIANFPHYANWIEINRLKGQTYDYENDGYSL